MRGQISRRAMELGGWTVQDLTLTDEDRALWKEQIMGSWEPPPSESPKVNFSREWLMRTIGIYRET